jgi:hypothetical protein
MNSQETPPYLEIPLPKTEYDEKPPCLNTALPITEDDKKLYTEPSVFSFSKEPVKKDLLSKNNLLRIKDIIQNIDTNPNVSKKILMENIHYLLYTDENNDTLLHKLARFSDEYPSDANFDEISSKSFGLLNAKYVKENFNKIINLIVNDEDIKNKLAEMKLDERFNIYCEKPIVISEINKSELDNNDDIMANKINKFFTEIKDKMNKINQTNHIYEPSDETKATEGGKRRRKTTQKRRKRKTQKRKRGKSKRRRRM